jgi:hypothetical protein
MSVKGEKYASAAAMKKHEGSEGAKERKKEYGKPAAKKVAKVMHEFKAGSLHSSSKKGPVVKSKKQALAIAMSEANMAKMMKKK